VFFSDRGFQIRDTLSHCALLALIQPLPREAPDRIEVTAHSGQSVVHVPLRPAIEIHIRRLGGEILLCVLDGFVDDIVGEGSEVVRIRRARLVAFSWEFSHPIGQ